MENDYNNYLEKTLFVPDLNLDIMYNIDTEFCINDFIPKLNDPLNNIKLEYVPLYVPNLEITDDYWVSSKEVQKHFEELVKYYSHVIELSEQYKLTFKAGKHYFWIRPKFWEDGTDHRISFAWRDTYDECLEILNALISNTQGWIFDDRDQHWKVVIYADESKFYFIQSDPDENIIHALINTNKEPIIQMAHECMNRVPRQIEKLTEIFGYDYWTKYQYERLF